MTDLLCLNLPFIPYYTRASRSPCVTRGGTLYYPMALLSMTSYAIQKGFDAKIMDLIANFDPNWKDEIKKMNPKVIAVDTATPSIYSDIKFADELQAEFPNSQVVLVGRFVTYAPTEALNLCKNVKVAARREMYMQIVELLKGNDYHHLDGFSYKKEDGKVHHNKDAEFVTNVDEFGMLAKVIKDQLNVNNYYYASVRNPYIMLQAAWGCPHKCAFCNEVIKNRYRHKSLDAIMEEIRFVKKELPTVKEIIWDDPTFVVNEEFTRELCNKMIEEKINMNWSAMTRANISLETLQLMKKAGAKTMHIGLESSTQDSLNFINKNMKFEDEVEYLKNCKKVGIMNHACFIMGLPNDTKETMNATIERAKKLPAVDSVQCFPLIPTPFEDIFDKESEGTIWDYLVKNNYLITRDYSQWLKPDGAYNCVISYPNLSNVEIEQFVEKIYKVFYYRPSFILHKLVQSLRSFEELKRNYRSFLTFRNRSSKKI